MSPPLYKVGRVLNWLSGSEHISRPGCMDEQQMQGICGQSR